MRSEAWVAALVLLAGCGDLTGDVFRVRPAARPRSLLVAGVGAPSSVGDLQRLSTVLDTPPVVPFTGFVCDLGYGSTFSAEVVAPVDAPAMVEALQRPVFDAYPDSLLRTSVFGGVSEWNDDLRFAGVVTNFGNAAAAARVARMRGLFFDTQTAGAQLFSRSTYPGDSFEGLLARVEQRGFEVGAAVEAAFPKAQFVVTIGNAEVWRAVCLDGTPQDLERYGLLPAFLVGLRRGGPTLQVVDGYLSAYSAREPAELEVFAAAIRNDLPALRAAWRLGVVSYRFPEAFSTTEWLGESTWPSPAALRCDDATRARVAATNLVGFGLLLDYRPSFSFGPDLSGNYHSPEGWAALVSGALDRAEGPVWLWSAKVDPLDPTNPGASPMPAAYLDALKQALP